MALLTPIIHCLVDPEPASFHAGDAAGETATFAANLSFEMPAQQTGMTREEIASELGADEKDARARLAPILHALQDVRFHLYQLNPPANEGDPYTLTLAADHLQPETISAPDQESKDDYVLSWLERQQRPGQDRYWTSLEQAFDPGQSVDAEEAGAAPRLRAAQAWNAPAGHRQGLTHLLRLKPIDGGDGNGEGGDDGGEGPDLIYVVLPHLADPADTLPTAVDVKGLDGDKWGEAAVECTYDVLGGLGTWICRTNPIGRIAGEPITAPPPAAPLDDALTADGFLVVVKDAEAIRRFLKAFEERAASIMTAANALHVDGSEEAGKDDPANPENLFGFNTSSAVAASVFHWGAAVWFVLSRLTAALDNHVLALLKPVAAGDAWKPNRESEGEVLAPLVSAILDELTDLKILGDIDGRMIAEAVRQVLRGHSPLVAGNTAPKAALVDALRHVYGIGEPKLLQGKTELDPADPASLVASMLATYGKGGDYDQVPPEAKAVVEGLVGKSVAALATVLIDIEQPLHDEAGAERALIRLFETVELHKVDPNKPEEDALTYRIAAAIAAGVPDAALQSAVASGWAKYKAVLEGPFNGAEAIRRAVSASFTDALLKTAGAARETLTSQRLRELTAAAGLYKRRLVGAMDDPQCFEAMARPLVKPDDQFRPASDELPKRLDAAYARAVAPLVTPPDQAARFTPDSFPMPLPIQIASGIDGSEIDDFARAFNGICVAVRRLDDNNSRWAHANLADLHWTGEKPTSGASGVLHPMLPAAADGRGSMFIDYEGFPFADPLEQQFGEDIAPGAQKPFYRHEPHGYSKSKFERLPRLAYGRKFQSFGFAVSNAGTLPQALQKDAAEPWLPHEEIERLFHGKWKAPDLFETDYQRRTAIARMAVIEQPDAGAPRRLGEAIVGVQPLCTGYPRLGVVADKGLPGVIDLFRDGDGAPRIHLPATIGRQLEWLIGELGWSGAPADLVLDLFDRTPDAPGTRGKFSTTIDMDLAALRDLRLVASDDGDKRKLEVLSGEKPVGEPFELDQAEASYWLRLELRADGAAALSFASPEGRRPAGEDAPLLLLAPPERSARKDEKVVPAWRPDLRRPIKVRVSTPRVGYLDFTRWMANATLRDKAYRANADFEEALLAAYMMRHLDAELARYLDTLPDPAVDAVRLEVSETDSLAAAALTPPLTQEVQLGAIFDSKGNKVANGRLADFVADFKKPAQGWSLGWLRKKLLELDEAFAFTVELSAGTSFTFADIGHITVAGGSVAQLSMHALVLSSAFEPSPHDDDPKTYHPSVFHPGLKQFATRMSSDGRRLGYPAAAIRIETMYDGIDAGPKADIGKWIDAAGEMIEAVPIANTRRFDIKTRDSLAYMKDGHVIIRANRNDWRLIGAIGVTTQRWRVGGRPIYHFIEPRRHAINTEATTGPALALKLDDRNKVEQFESEAFFDRPDIDAQTVTQQVAPLGTRTVLQQHSWDAPSATYFRHRFTLRSRYAGALVPQFKRSVDAWLTKDELGKGKLRKERGWTMRVAMLADAGRLILARPQLRALVPLTTAPGGESAALPAPPVAAILQEPPYSRGGLADRIAPEIRTGLGYGFESPKKEGEEPPVEILDSRKEIGPNPQLSYRAFDLDKTLDAERRRQGLLGLSLRGEGPLGLTFDMPDAPAPAFANTMLSLRPLSLSGPLPPLEEAMMAVAMRRYLDPHWLAGPGAAEQSDPDLPADRTWWVEFAAPDERPVTLTFRQPDGVPVSIAKISVGTDADADHLIVAVWKEAIDKVKGYKDPIVTIARVERRHVGALAILHQPIAPGRYSTSVLVAPQSVRVADG